MASSRGYAHVHLLGNVGSKPELRYTASGTAVLGFSLAVNPWRPNSEDGPADWYRISIFGKRGEAAEKLIVPGDRILVSGTQKFSAYETNSGEARSSVEVTANEFELLSPPRKAAS